MLRDQLAEALQGVVLALDRDEHLAAGDHGVHREQAQRRRAVDEDVVDPVAGSSQSCEVRLRAPCRAGVSRATSETSSISAPARSIDAGSTVRPGMSGHGRTSSSRSVPSTRASYTPGVPSEWGMLQRGRGVALRIEVDDAGRAAPWRPAPRRCSRRRRLAHAALLVGDDEDPRLPRAVGSCVVARRVAPGRRAPGPRRPAESIVVDAVRAASSANVDAAVVGIAHSSAPVDVSRGTSAVPRCVIGWRWTSTTVVGTSRSPSSRTSPPRYRRAEPVKGTRAQSAPLLLRCAPSARAALRRASPAAGTSGRACRGRHRPRGHDIEGLVDVLGPRPQHRDCRRARASATASSRKVVRRSSGSIRVTCRSGRAMAQTRPGRPAPTRRRPRWRPRHARHDHRAVQDVPLPEPRRPRAARSGHARRPRSPGGRHIARQRQPEPNTPAADDGGVSRETGTASGRQDAGRTTTWRPVSRPRTR